MTMDQTKERDVLALLASNDFDALRALGYSASDLRALGYSASALLAAGCSASALLAAGYSASDLRAAGYSASDLRALGYSASDLRAAGYSASDLRALEDSIPLIESPYTKLRDDLAAKRRQHKQSTWGPEDAPTPEPNICNTPMCTAGHLVSMGGDAGWTLKQRYGWAAAAAMIHYKAHPGQRCQNFGAIPDAWALAYIEKMAEHEESLRNPAQAVDE